MEVPYIKERLKYSDSEDGSVAYEESLPCELPLKLRNLVAECFEQVQHFYQLLQEAAHGLREYISLTLFSCENVILFKDGAVFDLNCRRGKSEEELEPAIMKALVQFI